MRSLLFTLLLLPFATYSQYSDSTRVSVITCGPSQDELYTAFGHSAFRIYDPVTGYDAAFNYGVFDFRQKNFYLNFARGYLYYKLGVHNYQDFEYHYMADNRSIHEQVLNLSKSQRNKLVEYLLWNARPGNEFYRYDYFYDNCATKIRDVVQKALGDSVQFSDSHIKTNYTIRELTDLYLEQQPWGDLGIDICLGLPMDKKAAPIEYMFLPDYVETGFDNASISTSNGKARLVKDKRIVFETSPEPPKRSLLHPLYIFTLCLLIACVVSFRDWQRKKISQWLDVILLTITGAIGLLLFLLWFATDHKAAATNFNLLWALPTNLIAVFALIKSPRWLRSYFLIALSISVLLLVTWIILPQMLHYALIPIVLMLALRYFIQFKLR